MNESHMRHLSRFRLVVSRITSFDDREVNVIVDVNVFHFDPQAGWISANITSVKLKIVHHCIPPNFGMERPMLPTTNPSHDRRPLAKRGWNVRNCLGSRAPRTLPSKTEMCSNFETTADTPAERASISVDEPFSPLTI